MPASDRSLGRPPVESALSSGFRLVWDGRTSVRARGQVLLGGSPWRISRLPERAQLFVEALRRAGSAGVTVHEPWQREMARVLIDRGFAHPAPIADVEPAASVVVVVPVLDRVDGLRSLLSSPVCAPVVVVDDGSADPGPIAGVAQEFGAGLTRCAVNRGPAAARNTGVAETHEEIVAFVDSDCVVEDGWPRSQLWHFNDPLVGAVAPRVVPLEGNGGVLARFEAVRSALDMGSRPELVRHGARLGFVPSAALLVRRSALGQGGFVEELRLGEDVDLVWRLGEAGWQVRFDPGVTVRHRGRERWRDWLVRSFEYGTSSASLEVRHPGKLAPARLTGWNLAVLVLMSARRPFPAFLVSFASASLLTRAMPSVPGRSLIAGETVVRGLLADAAQIGRLLRREWWPVGMVALMSTRRSRVARMASACMLVPIAWDYVRTRPRLDPLRYGAIQLVDDAAYGSGVIASSIRARTWLPLIPQVSVPSLRNRRVRRSRGRFGP